MERVTPLAWIAVTLASVAAIIQPFAALGPLFLGLISVSISLVFAGLVMAARAQRDVEEAITLQNRWRAQRDRCKCGPCRVQLRAAARATTPEVLQNATPPPAPPAPEPPEPEPVTTGRDLIFEEADQ